MPIRSRRLLRSGPDLSFVESPAQFPDLRYERRLFDELGAVRGALREPGSGTFDVVAAALQAHGVALADLPAARYFSDNDVLKMHLLATPDALGFLSRRALMAEPVAGLEEVPIRSLCLARQLAAVWLLGAIILCNAVVYASFRNGIWF